MTEPSKEDLERAVIVVRASYRPNELEEVGALEMGIAKALAEVRAEGEREIIMLKNKVQDQRAEHAFEHAKANSVIFEMEAEKSAIEKEKAGLEERVKIIEQDRDSWRRCAERLETEKTEPKLTINIEESAIKELFKNQAEELTRLKSRNEELERDKDNLLHSVERLEEWRDDIQKRFDERYATPNQHEKYLIEKPLREQIDRLKAENDRLREVEFRMKGLEK